MRHPRSRPHVPAGPRLLGAAELRRLAAIPVDAGVARAAVIQGGPLTLQQLRLLGLTDRQVRCRMRAGRLLRPWRGIYVPGHLTWDACGQTVGALLAIGEGWACGASAAWLHGLLEHPPPFPHVLRVGGARAQRRGLVVHRCKAIGPDEVMVLRGIPTVTPQRAMLELAATSSAAAVAEAMAAGEVRKLLTRDEVHEAMCTRWQGHRGLKLLRAELADGLAPKPTRSRTERLLRRIASEVGWPPARMNEQLLGLERDVIFDTQRVIVEVDGREHFTERAADADRRRDSATAAAGWLTMRATGRRLVDDGTRFGHEVLAALASREVAT